MGNQKRKRITAMLERIRESRSGVRQSKPLPKAELDRRARLKIKREMAQWEKENQL